MVAALLGLDRAGGWRRVREDKDCGIAVFRARPAALAWSHGAGPADPASRFDAIKVFSCPSPSPPPRATRERGGGGGGVRR
eukprot:1139143-Rhodomonas_salina.1